MWSKSIEAKHSGETCWVISWDLMSCKRQDSKRHFANGRKGMKRHEKKPYKDQCCDKDSQNCCDMLWHVVTCCKFCMVFLLFCIANSSHQDPPRKTRRRSTEWCCLGAAASPTQTPGRTQTSHGVRNSKDLEITVWICVIMLQHAATLRHSGHHFRMENDFHLSARSDF